VRNCAGRKACFARDLGVKFSLHISAVYSFRHFLQVVSRSKVRVVKMLVVVVVLFAFCWLPLYAVNVRIYFGSPLEVDDAEFRLLTQTVIPMAQWIGLSSCAVNPIVYCLFSSKFRDGFRSLLVTESCCRHSHAPVAGGLRRWSAAATTDPLVNTVVDYRSQASTRPRIVVSFENFEMQAV